MYNFQIKKITLPEWLPTKDIQFIFNSLSNIGESRLIGGCVRDILQKKKSKDLDIATSALPGKVKSLFDSLKINTLDYGISHGTVAVVLNNKVFEITTLRKDIETDGRRAVVEFTDCWKEDAARRDFTFNAMSLDLSGNLYDYFGGLEDLNNKLIKFVGDPETRINEDYLRILRFFRFFAYFQDCQFDQQGLDACSKLSKHLDIISGERIHSEIFKMLGEANAKQAIKFMTEKKIFQSINLPDIDLSQLDKYRFSLSSVANLSIILLSTPYPKTSLKNIIDRWKLTRSEIRILNFLLGIDISLELDRKKMLYYFFEAEKEFTNPLISFFLSIYPKMDEETIKEMSLNSASNPLPIDGHDITKLGYKNEAIKEKLNDALKYWIDSSFQASKFTLLEKISNK